MRLYDGLGCSLFLFEIGGLVALHVVRFSPAARFASLDYLSQSEIMAHRSAVYQSYSHWWSQNNRMGLLPPFTGQFFRGQYLLGLVCWVWAGTFFLLFIAGIASFVHSKKYGSHFQKL